MVFPKKCTRLTVYPQWKPVYLSAARWWRMKWQCMVVGAGPIKFLMIAFDCWLLVALLWLNDCMAAYSIRLRPARSIYVLLRCINFFFDEQIKPSRGSRHYMSRGSCFFQFWGHEAGPKLNSIQIWIKSFSWSRILFYFFFKKCYRI